MKKLICIIVLFFSLLQWRGTEVRCQDVHFSQFFMTPTLLNPALTGVYDGNQRAFLNYKDQWRGMGAPGATYNTGLFSFDTHLLKKKHGKGYLGIGINALNDVAGDLKMGTTQLNISVAGIVFINEKQLISGGLQGGYVQKSISTSAMQWENQYDGSSGAFNSSLSSNDISSVPTVRYADFSAGLAWTYGSKQTSLSANDELKLNFGLAAFNINTPKQNFIAFGSNDQLNQRLVIHSGARIGIRNTNIVLVPNVVFFKQGSSSEFDIGTSVRWMLKNESRYTGNIQGMALSLGAQYRLNDALIPMIMLEWANYTVGFSYDVNTSSLVQGTHGRGGIEISLRFIGPNPFASSSTRLLD